MARLFLPLPLRHTLRARQQGQRVWPPIGMVRFGSLKRTEPISYAFGFDRGHCIDRFYIEDFLSRHGADICGRVLEIADNEYTHRFGGARVTQSDVLYAQEGHAKATIVADLTHADNIPSNTFDCIILTQTLQFIYDVRGAVATLNRILKPGGVLLATFPGISQISRYDMDRWGDYWRFTSLSASMLFGEVFPAANVSVKTYGNVTAAVALFHGLAVEDLRHADLNHFDPDYEVVITVRAVRTEVSS